MRAKDRTSTRHTLREMIRFRNRLVSLNGIYVRCVSILLVLVVLALPARTQESCSLAKGVPVGMQGVMCAAGVFNISLAGKTATGSGFNCDGQHDWTNKVWPELIPDKTYVMTAGVGICVTGIYFDVPQGYTLEIDGVETSTVDKTQGGLIFTGDGSWNVVLRKKCACGKQGAGEGATSQGSVVFNLGMGYLANGQSAEQISIRQDTLSASIYTPAALIYSPPARSTAVDVVRDGSGNLRQIKAPQSFADVVVISTSEYEIRYYDPANVGAKVNGIYTLTGSPYVTWKVSNPSPTTTTKLRISKMQGATTLEQSEYLWDPAVDSWTLSTGWSSPSNYARVETKTISYPTQTSRMEMFIVKDGSGQIASKRTKTYLNYPWGWELVQEVEDPDAAALTKTYTYYEDPAVDTKYRRLKSITFPDGSWEKYDYDVFSNLSTVMRPWKDLSMDSATESNSRLTIYGYSNSDNGVFGISAFPKIIYDIEEKIAGVTVRKLRYNRSEASLNPYAIAEAESLYSGSVNGVPTTLVTQTITTRYHWSAAELLRNRVAAVEYPDGRKDYYSYEKGNYVTNPDPSLNAFTVDANGLAERVTIVHGTTTSPAGVAFKTTKDVTIHDQFGNSVYLETYIYNGTDYERSAWTANEFDTRGHVLTTRDSRGQLSTAVWNGDLKTSEIDAAGVETTYTYDALNRVVNRTKKGIAAGTYPAQADIVTTYTYDGEGRQTSEVMTGGGLSLSNSRVYDPAGRLTKETDQVGLNTTYSYLNGGRTKTTTSPGGATQITDDYLDGQSKTVTGSAVVARAFDYGVNADGTRFTQEFLGTAGLSSPRWTKTTIDWVDRTVTMEKPSFTGTNVVQTSFYNSLGQLQKLTTTAGPTKLIADTLYEYDQLGQQTRTGLDINADGVLTLASTDRLSDVDTVFEKVSTDWFTVNSTKTYLTDNNDTPTIQVARQRLNNFPLNGTDQTVSELTRIDPAGNSTKTTTTVDRAAKKQTTTIDTPESNVNSVNIRVNGLLQSETAPTPQAATTYTYDSLSRQLTVVDARTGTATRSYSPTTGQLISTDDGAGTTSYEYYPSTHNSAGRLKAQTNAAGKKINFNYNSRGQVVQTWGDATYPIEYVYDTYGQRTEMHTFRGGQNWSASVWPAATTGAADITKWIYQASTGLLTQKQDATLKGATYTYDELGRPRTRVWARGVTCTYGTDANTGELRTISYSDSTPAVSFSYDRGGRRTTVTDAAGSHTRTFNVAGELQTEQITGGILDGVGINVGYDSLLRRNSLQTTQGANTLSSQTYGYDASSRLETITSGSKTATYAYYPNSGLLNTTTFTGGTNIARGYDTLGRLQSINTTPAADAVQSYAYTYNNLNQRTGVTREDGSYWTYLYNDRGELKSGKKYWSDNAIVWGAQTEYNFDNIGNRVTARQGGNQLGSLRQSDYSSNTLNQYTQRTAPGAVDISGTAIAAANVTVNNQTTARKGAYFYKELAVDNSTAAVYPQINVVGARNNFGAGGQDAVTEKGGRTFVPANPENFTYDDDGNLLSDGRWSYSWDAEDRLVSVEALPTVPVEAKRRFEFSYDSLSKRISRKEYEWNTSTSSYQLLSVKKSIYDDWNVMSEIDGNNVLVKNYVWGVDLSGSLRGAGGIGGLLMINEAGASYFVGYDGTASVTSIIHSASGAIAASYEYDPFGNVIKSTGSYSDKNQFQYSTKYTEPTVGISYFGYRDYNPSSGRWLSRDPSEENGGINLYGFVNNNPTTFHDKLGLYVFRVVFDAFIHKNLGEWADEPGTMGAEFRTDFRAFGEFDEHANEDTGNARLWSLIEVESTKIGKLEKEGVSKAFSEAGMSHRRLQLLPLTNYWSKPMGMRASVKNPKPVIKDVSSCESTFWFKPSAAYPFIPSPDIDYDIVITLKILDKKQISVSITGTHDNFPYYEAQVNKDQPFYTFDPGSSGPGLKNLNTTAKPISVAPYILREN